MQYALKASGLLSTGSQDSAFAAAADGAAIRVWSR